MILVFITCASILSTSPGCRIHRVPLVVDVIPSGCAAKVEAVVAEKAPLHPGERVVRFGCQRRGRA